MENDASHAIEGRLAVTAELSQTPTHYHDKEQARGACVQVRVSRRLWERAKAN